MKAALASSLAYRPKLIVLDEPFSGLDPLVRDEFIEGLLESAGEATILISSHDLAEIESFASHVGYLERGRLRFSEEMTALSARFREVEVTLDAAPVLPANWPANVAPPGEFAGGSALCRVAIRRGSGPWPKCEKCSASRAASRSPRCLCARFSSRLRQSRKEGRVKQALHIFKKDVRHLRWEIAISLLLMMIFVYTQLHRSALRESYAAIRSYLILAFWAFLSARVIQAEPIPGDRQFWITRPYQWRSLLGAKLLFIIAIIGLPLLIADAVILRVAGFSVVEHSLALVWALILMTASTLIAFLAFATLTRSLTEWMLAAIAVVGADYLIAVFANAKIWGGVEWMREYSYAAIMFAVAMPVLLWQFKSRGAVASIAMMAAGLLGSSLFLNYAHSTWALELESRFSMPKVDPSLVQIAARPLPHALKLPPLGRKQEVILLAIPIDISGLGHGLDLMSDDVRLSVTNGGGQLWSSKATGERIELSAKRARRLSHPAAGRSLGFRQRPRPAGEHPCNALPDHAAGRSFEDSRGRRRGRWMSPARDVAGTARGRTWVVCETPLRTPPNVLAVGFKDERRDRFLSGTSYSPFPADINSSLTPLRVVFAFHPYNSTSATLTSLEPVAHFRRDLDLANVYLADYQLPSPF